MPKFNSIYLKLYGEYCAVLTLNRPHKHHALNQEMINELSKAIDYLSKDISIKTIVIESFGKIFCAGGDLNWMREQMSAPEEEKRKAATDLAGLFSKLYHCPKTIIAKVQGHAFGGGIGILATCDIVWATKSAKFSLSEVKLGLIPATIGPYVIKRIGEANSKKFMLNGCRFDAIEAKTAGLITDIADDDKALDAKVKAQIESYQDIPIHAMIKAKNMINQFNPSTTMIENSINDLMTCWHNKETQKIIEDFLKANHTIPTL